MDERCVYYGKQQYFDLIRTLGGTWDDYKKRPLVCLIKSYENDSLYWAIPVSSWDEKKEAIKQKINDCMALPSSDFRSCYYHRGKVGRRESVFYITDVVPITEKYIERPYLSFNRACIIKNNELIGVLEDKLKRVLNYENGRNNFFRQRISTVKKFLLDELNT